MLFHSQQFVLFFAAVFIVYWFVLNRFSSQGRVHHLWLLVTSYVFYMSWNVPLASLMLLSSAVAYIGALEVHRTHKRRWLLFSLIVNLGVLGTFKYANFFLDSVNETLLWLGLAVDPFHLRILLPLGISFYTFQSLSYTLDVYRGKYPPYESFYRFCLYIAFFPQLIAGPIVRADCFHYQLDRPRKLHWITFYGGFSRFVFGVFKKAVLANQAAAFADAVFADPGQYSGLMNLVGVYAFAFQIYFDFSGYTDMALGLLTMLGFKIPENFEHPYEAASIREFWQRWHISLSTWLRDYLYIPLGGSHGTSLQTYRNLFITFGLGGLWHGAGWNFFIWGMLHGAYLSIERLIRGPRFDRPKNRLVDLILVVFTFHLVCLSWVFFRAETFSIAREMLAALVDLPGYYAPAEFGLFKVQNWFIGFWLPLGVLVASRFHKIDKTLRSYPLPVAVGLLTLMLILVALITGGANEFIYFQF